MALTTLLQTLHIQSPRRKKPPHHSFLGHRVLKTFFFCVQSLAYGKLDFFLGDMAYRQLSVLLIYKNILKPLGTEVLLLKHFLKVLCSYRIEGWLGQR